MDRRASCLLLLAVLVAAHCHQADAKAWKVNWDIKKYHTLTIKRGDTVTFIWKSGLPHGVSEGSCKHHHVLHKVTRTGTHSVKPHKGSHYYVCQSAYHCPYQSIKVVVK